MRQIIITLLLCCLNSLTWARLPLQNLKLPKGYHISIYANVANARSLALGDNGVVYVGTRRLGRVYALLPNKARTRARKVVIWLRGLNMPNGVAFKRHTLYVAALEHIYKFRHPNANKPHRGSLPQIVSSLPNARHHGWRYMTIGPDNYLYVAIGAPCNVCERSDARFASIMRISTDGRQQQIYAHGVRNSVGMTFSPITQKLVFTDNGRDWLGDNLPPDELNIADKAGQNFGYPYYFGKNKPDPKYGKKRSAKGMTPAALNLGPHVAALGLMFYTGKMFPASMQNQLLIAEHGSWNRRQKIGYRIVKVGFKNNRPISYQPFISGWLDNEEYWGRPVDLLQLPDGSVLISDDYAGVVYRLTYKKPS